MSDDATPGNVPLSDLLGQLPEPYTRQWINAPFTERLLFSEEQMISWGEAQRMRGVHSVQEQTAVIVRAALVLLEAVEGCEAFPPEKIAAFRRVFGA